MLYKIIQNNTIPMTYGRQYATKYGVYILLM